MFEFLTRRVLEPPAFGLDISDLTVKFIRLAWHGTTLALDYFGEVDIPAGVIVDGEVRQEDELVRILQTRLRTADGRPLGERYCVASLPEEKSFVRVIELPNLKSEDVGHAVRWEVEGVVPLPLEELVFDFELTPGFSPPSFPRGFELGGGVLEPISGGADDHRDVLITAFPRGIVASYHRLLARAGLIPLALELESQAISRAIIRDASFHESVIIVDIGMNRTSFIIFAGGSMIFTKSITIGGRNFEEAIQQALRVSLEEARAIKIESGLNKNYRGGKVLRALLPHLETLTAELEQQIRFYRDHPAKRHKNLGDIERIVLCGGDANLIGFEKYVAVVIKKPTVLGAPFANLPLPPGVIPPIPKNESLKYTTAIGLALRAAGL